MSSQEKKKTLENNLRQMVMQNFNYMGNCHKLINFRFIENEVHIVTHRSWLTFPIEKAGNIIREEFIETDEKISLDSKSLPAVYQKVKDSKITAKMITLIDDIETGKVDLKRAAAMNQTVKTILDIVRTEKQISKKD